MTAPVFIDTETLGLDPRSHAVWEVAAIVDGAEYVWHIELGGEQMLAADPVAVQISGFDERYPPAGERCPVDQFLDQFLALTAGRHLCGAVVSFDEERLRRLAWERGRTPSWHYHLIDVEALAVGYLAGVGEALELPWKSDTLSEAIGVDPPGVVDRHTALGDARWAKAIYESILGS